jgi:alkylated DNA repair protein (DNA oxidative demethylase)
MTPASHAAQDVLFVSAEPPRCSHVQLEPGAVLLEGFAAAEAPALLAAIEQVSQAAPLRQMMTARGWRMSVAMTNCGDAGWVSDRSGYRYDTIDPLTGRRWPAMPEVVADLAVRAAGASGFDRFAPDACLVNRYEPGARLALHQDRDERDFDAPIVSVSLGVPATFLWGGAARSHRPRRLRLEHADVVVWGGPARLHFHGVDTLRQGHHPLTGSLRFNLTLRCARRSRDAAAPRRDA